MRVAILRAPIDVAALIDEVGRAGNGATVLFTGTVRDQNEGRAVHGIEYTAYVDMAERELANIVRESCEKFGTDDVIAVHRIGHLAVGEASVAIVAAHPHRDEAYAASRYVIEQIKVRLPVWKREAYVDGGREWVGRDSGLETRDSGADRAISAAASKEAAAQPEARVPDSQFPIPGSRSDTRELSP